MTTTERIPLSRDRIAAATLRFVDANGLEALSMRKLGSELQVEAMSLYNHVSSKDDLLDAVAEVMYRELLSDYGERPEGTWQADARAMADAWRRVGHHHPNAFTLVADRPFAADEGMRVFQECYRIFTNAGLAARDAGLAFDTAASWVVGAIRQEIGLMYDLESGKGLDPAEMPLEFRGAAELKEACLSWTADERFAHGFAIIIAGLEATFAIG